LPLAPWVLAEGKTQKNQIHIAPVLNETETASCMHLHFVALQGKLRSLFFPMITNAPG
jgi:hypothetical protein